VLLPWPLALQDLVHCQLLMQVQVPHLSPLAGRSQHHVQGPQLLLALPQLLLLLLLVHGQGHLPQTARLCQEGPGQRRVQGPQLVQQVQVRCQQAPEE
jgi:hypothetical protein